MSVVVLTSFAGTFAYSEPLNQKTIAAETASSRTVGAI
jgi:hypothetical protein